MQRLGSIAPSEHIKNAEYPKPGCKIFWIFGCKGKKSTLKIERNRENTETNELCYQEDKRFESYLPCDTRPITFSVMLANPPKEEVFKT